MTAKRIVDRLVTVAAAVATPVVALLIDTHEISAAVGVDVGAIVAAAVGAYHGGALVQRRAGAYHVTDPDQ